MRFLAGFIPVRRFHPGSYCLRTVPCWFHSSSPVSSRFLPFAYGFAYPSLLPFSSWLFPGSSRVPFICMHCNCFPLFSKLPFLLFVFVLFLLSMIVIRCNHLLFFISVFYLFLTGGVLLPFMFISFVSLLFFYPDFSQGMFCPFYMYRVYFFSLLWSRTSLRGCVDICHCAVNSVRTTGLFVHVDTLGASLLPPIFLSIYTSWPCTTINRRFLTLYHHQYTLVVPPSSRPRPVFQQLELIDNLTPDYSSFHNQWKHGTNYLNTMY